MRQSKYISVFVVLAVLGQFEETQTQSCIPSTTQCSSNSGDYALLPVNQSLPYFYIGGIFSVHSAGANLYSCGSIRERGVQNLEAFLWAVESFQRRYPDKLQGTQIGALAIDSCLSPEKAIQKILNFENCESGYGTPAVEPGSMLAFVGPDTSSQASLLEPIFIALQKPLVSHAATSPSLSNNDYFLRTVPSDLFQIQGMVELFKQQAIQYVQVIYSSNAFGMGAMQEFSRLSEEENICSVTTKQIPSQYSDSDLDVIVRSLNDFGHTKIVILFANDFIISDILKASKRVYVEHTFTWVGTNSWGTLASVVDGVEATAAGAVTFSLDASSTNNLADYDSYFRNIVGTKFTLSNNPWFDEYIQNRGSNNVEVEIDPYVPYTIQAVDAILTGIDEAIKSKCNGVLCPAFNQVGKGALVFEKISNIELGDFVEFDDSGDQVNGRYTVNKYMSPNTNGIATYNYDTIGTYHQNQLVLEENLEVISVCGATPCVACGEAATTTPIPTTMFSTTLSPFPSRTPIVLSAPSKLRDGTWVIVLLILAAIGILLVIAFEIYLTYKMSGKSFIRSMWLGQMLLFALFLSFLCLFAFVPSPTTITCGITRFGVGICYAMIFSIFLVKLMIIFSSKSVGYLKGIFQFLMFIFAWGVQIGINVEWLVMRNPEAIPTIDNSTGLATAWTCSQSFTTHVITLSYVMFLIVVCCILSFKAHGIVTNHREVVYIGICSFLSVLIFLAWILLGMLHTNKDFEDPCLAFGLFIIAIIVLLTMYLPKVKQLNSIEKGDIYVDDETPQYTTPSLIPPSLQAPSLVFGNGTIDKSHYMSHPIVYVDDIDGDIYSAPIETKVHRLHVDVNPEALYLKHPGSLNRLPVVRNNSLRSAAYSVHSVPVDTTRVLRRTADLSGRTPVVIEERAHSEAVIPTISRGYAASEVLTVPRHYGTAKSVRSVASARSVKSGGTLGRGRSLHDVGSL